MGRLSQPTWMQSTLPTKPGSPLAENSPTATHPIVHQLWSYKQTHPLWTTSLKSRANKNNSSLLCCLLERKLVTHSTITVNVQSTKFLQFKASLVQAFLHLQLASSCTHSVHHLVFELLTDKTKNHKEASWNKPLNLLCILSEEASVKFQLYSETRSTWY